MNPNYQTVSVRAGNICEYCHAPEAVFNFPFEVEHIFPLALGGETIEENLALSCRSCNIYKSDKISTTDKKTKKEIRFYNPRLDVWEEHFIFQKETGEISAITEIGESTIRGLKINSKIQIEARKQWAKLDLI
jgi:hypothetical protein